MENMITVKGPVIAGIGAVGGVIAGFFGGWDAALITLLIFMGVDYITGLIVAGVFKKLTLIHISDQRDDRAHCQKHRHLLERLYRSDRLAFSWCNPGRRL